MRSLFARVMVASLVAVGVFALVTTAAVASRVSISLADWTRVREADLREGVAAALRPVFADAGVPTPERIEDALAGQLRPGTHVAVFGPRLEPIFAYRSSAPPGSPDRPGSDGETAGRRRGMQPGRRMGPPNAEELAPIRVSGETRGYFVAGTEGFAADVANQRLVRSLLTAVLAGVAAASVLAAGTSFFFSRHLASEAGTLAEGLKAIESGERSVEFRRSGPAELASIARSADSLQTELGRQEALRRQWAADIAHDLRTPVAALRSQLEAMADGVLQPTNERLTRALGELGRLEALVADLRTLTQLESPELEIRRRTVDLRDLIRESVQRFTLIAARRSITIEPTLQSITVSVDPDSMDRALTNIVANAVQYSAEGAVVAVTSEATDTEVCIAVANPGWISEAELPKLFDRLYRGEASRTTPGSGLGLTIALEIVKRHGGTVSVENTPGPTVVVRVCIPIAH